ncbi:MAG: glycosyltransferase family 4 protein [Chitinophagaceae bacterium]
MPDKETLIILIPGFPKDEADSTCLPFQQAFVSCLKKNYPALNIVILTFQYPFETKEYTFQNIPVISFGGKNKGGLSKLLLRRKINKQLEKNHKSFSIKAILSFWCGECALVGSRFARKHGLKHYCWLMGQDAKADNRYPRKIKFAPDELITLSDFLQDEFERNHHIRPHKVILPGIDTASLQRTATAKDVDLLAVGSLIPLKQYDLFIETVSRVRETIPNVKAVLIGEGPEIENLLALIKTKKIESAIQLTGELPHAVVIQYMHRSKLLLHPSAYEGFGMVCIEALYAGAAVISFVKPMKKEVPGWYIVTGAEEMSNKAVELLSAYTPVSASGFDITHSVTAFMSLIYPAD